jgi:hypothetical protein
MRKTIIFLSAVLLLVSSILVGHERVLRGEIELSQGSEAAAIQTKFQPVFPVNIAVVVKNLSDKPTPVGKISVRYALPQPYQNTKDSIMFTTEELPLPEIAPHAEVRVAFKTPQALPTIADFVRQDWAMRLYQAVVTVNGKEEVIGTQPLTYSAYYYPLKTRD